MLLVALVTEDLLEAVESASVWHFTSGKRSHGVQTSSNLIEGHRCKGTNKACNGGASNSIDPMGTEEVVGVLLEIIVDASHRAAKRGNLKGIGRCTSHQSTFLHGAVETVQEVAVVSSGSLRIELVNLHSVEDDVNGVCEETGRAPSKNASV